MNLSTGAVMVKLNTELKNAKATTINRKSLKKVFEVLKPTGKLGRALDKAIGSARWSRFTSSSGENWLIMGFIINAITACYEIEHT